MEAVVKPPGAQVGRDVLATIVILEKMMMGRI